MKQTGLVLTLFLILAVSCGRSEYSVESPDGSMCVKVSVKGETTWSLYVDGKLVCGPSAISMTLSDGKVYGHSGRPENFSLISRQGQIKAPVYRKSVIDDCFNELTLDYSDYAVQVRAYDEGVAYRFRSKSTEPFRVENEQASFMFPDDWKCYVPYSNNDDTDLNAQFFCSFENRYQHIPLSGWDTKRIAFLPVMIDAPDGVKLLITESDLRSYPGMFLSNWDQDNSLTGVFAPLPDQIEQGGHNMLQGIVKTRKGYIAEKQGATDFPWRIIAVSRRDIDMADNDMVYKLAKPSDPAMDFSWVRPGKVAWEWWNDWNIRGINFQPGVNTATYKHYIDFASENGIEYVILDEGWSVNLAADLYQIVPEIDLNEILSYAEKKNVGIILWAGYWALNRDIEGLFKHYSEMGVKGFKIDFMDRDDQMILDFLEESASIAARYHLLVDYHGTSKPSGLHRTYPNIINYEGIHGLENMKWSPASVDQVTYDVTVPYIRFMAGPADYTQGAMHNATRSQYRPSNHSPMSQGTRCHQLAEYIVFSSPLNMLCDSPSNYREEPECTAFISAIPTVWDRTRALDGEITEYAVIARQKDNTWYVGALNGWKSRDLDLDLDFLGQGDFSMTVFSDGADADVNAQAYTVTQSMLPESRHVRIHMASGGGWIARIVPITKESGR